MIQQISRVKKIIKGFTLVELIIVIAIVAILSVSAFIILTKWIGESRDSRRLSDIQTIKKSLTVNYVDPTTAENYPKPDNAQTVTGYSGEKLWYQGYFGSGVAKNTASISKAPKDPSGTGYEYSVSADQETFEIYSKLENLDKVSYITNKSYAKDNKYIVKKGNYNGYIIGVQNSKYNFYNSPSLFMTSGKQLISGSINKIYKEGKSKKNFSTFVTGLDITNLRDNNLENDESVYLNISKKYGMSDIKKAKSEVSKAARGIKLSKNNLNKCKENLISYWDFDNKNTNGNITIDRIGYSNGTLSNVLTGSNGKVSNSYEFNNSSNSIINLDNKISFSSDENWTVMYWYKSKNDDNNISFSDGSSTEFYHSNYEGGYTLRGVNGEYIWSSFNLDNNQRFFVTIVKDGNSVTLYQDLNNLGTKTINDEFNISKIGSDSSGYYRTWDGFLDEIAIFNNSLSKEKIEKLYTNSLNGSHYCY